MFAPTDGITQEGVVKVLRALEGFEYLAMIGWCENCWPPSGQGSLGEDRQSFTEVVARLSGNAFCAFHYIPVQLSLMATWGKFHTDEAKKQLKKANTEKLQSQEGAKDAIDRGASDSEYSSESSD